MLITPLKTSCSLEFNLCLGNWPCKFLSSFSLAKNCRWFHLLIKKESTFGIYICGHGQLFFFFLQCNATMFLLGSTRVSTHTKTFYVSTLPFKSLGSVRFLKILLFNKKRALNWSQLILKASLLQKISMSNKFGHTYSYLTILHIIVIKTITNGSILDRTHT